MMAVLWAFVKLSSLVMLALTLVGVGYIMGRKL